MSTSITQVQNKGVIRDAEFVRLDVPGAADTPYFFSSSYRKETITDPVGGTTAVSTSTYTPLGALMAVSGNQRDLTVTSHDTSITLAGIDPTKLGQILDVGLKGSRIQIYRGFYNSNYELDGTPVLRYTGIVTSYGLNEDVTEGYDTFTLTLNCSSYKVVLENRMSGRYTNDKSWQNYTDGDTSMSNVANVSRANFQFGVPKNVG